MSGAKILNITGMSNNESKWVALDKIEYQDPSGKKRVIFFYFFKKNLYIIITFINLSNK